MNYLFLSQADIEGLCEFSKEFFPDGWNKSQLISAFKSSDFYCLGCKKDDTLIAFITYQLSFEQADINDVIVNPSFRRLGIATNLIERCCQNLAKQGVKTVFLEVRASNIPAISLYKKLGFVELSVRKKYYSDGENALILKKELL